MSEFSCAVCRHHSLSILSDYARLPRVTSDCKPWPAGGQLAVCPQCGAIQKLRTEHWFEEIGRIYAQYQVYELSNGAEQVVFDEKGQPVARSEVLARHLQSLGQLEDTGHLIDVGCGNGSALRSFSNMLPGWRFSGSELSAQHEESMRNIRGFVALNVCPVDQIVGSYDVVTMIHSLEHFPDPKQALIDVRELLTDTGVLLVEVPDVETSPFDVLVADHLNHFTRDSLRYLAEEAGFEILSLTNTVLPKENTLVARKANPVTGRLPQPEKGINLASTRLEWLNGLLETARNASLNRPFGLFGSSISGMWLLGALDGQVDFLIDEDVTRVGQKIDGKPIFSPAEAPAGATVFVPLAPQIAPRVIKRLEHLPLTFVSL